MLVGVGRRALLRSVPRGQRILRSFSKGEIDGKIPSDLEQQTGRRLEELLAEQKGEVAFNRDPIVPTPDQGTKTNPILVPSAYNERVVGYEDPDCGQLVWFNLSKGPLHYIPDIDLYFKLYPVS